MKIKFSEELMRKLCATGNQRKANHYWFPIKSNGNHVADIHLMDAVKWDWDVNKTGPSLKKALEAIVTAAYEQGREDEKREITQSLEGLRKLFHS